MEHFTKLEKSLVYLEEKGKEAILFSDFNCDQSEDHYAKKILDLMIHNDMTCCVRNAHDVLVKDP